MFDRILKLMSINDMEKIQNTKILLVGVGGVGGYVLESLVRSGFQNILIVDGDNIDISNLNRQIIAKMDNLGYSKVEEAYKRMTSINPAVNIKTIKVHLTIDNFNEYINDSFDFIIDACDDLKIKLELIKYANNTNTKIITALGTARKLDASKLKITKLNKTFNDPLAKKLRYELRKNNLDLNIPVVFSEEEAIKTTGNLGSVIFVPACAGIMIANYVFLEVINNKTRA